MKYGKFHLTLIWLLSKVISSAVEMGFTILHHCLILEFFIVSYWCVFISKKFCDFLGQGYDYDWQPISMLPTIANYPCASEGFEVLTYVTADFFFMMKRLYSLIKSPGTSI